MPGNSRYYAPPISTPTSSAELWHDLPEEDVLPEVHAGQSPEKTPKNSQDSLNTLVGEQTPTPLGKRKRDESPSRPVQRTRLNEYQTPFLMAEELPLSWVGPLRNCLDGITWEVARLADFKTGTEVNTLKKLQGTHQEVGPEVLNILKKRSGGKAVPPHLKAEYNAKSPWQALDDEEESLRTTGTGGTGPTSDDPAMQYTQEPYGGLVEFVVKLQTFEKEPKVVLLPPQKCPSTRLARRFGSKRFFRLRINKKVMNGCDAVKLLDLFRRPFVLMNRVYRAFTAKDMNVFFIETWEEVVGGKDKRVQPRTGKRLPTDPMPFLEFIKWFNPLETNTKQTMAKWASRFLLGLSNSVPGVKLKPSNIFYIPDIDSDSFNGQGKPSSEQVMTDGCGWANKAFLRLTQAQVGWDELPTAVQVRLAGAKGLLLLHPGVKENENTEPKAWIRDSQKKISYAEEPNKDPAMLTVDVLRASHMKTPARLSTETIINLAENGVPRHVFEKMFIESLEEALEGLMAWSREENADGTGGSSIQSRRDLWANVARAGAVINARIARMCSSSARAKGLVFEVYADDVDDDDEEEHRETSPAWWPDPTSGQPSSIEETVLCLLDAGFDPVREPILREKLKAVIQRVIDSHGKRCKIPVVESCSAFVVPDPCGVLEEGEIQVKSSHRMQFSDGWERQTVLGDVLVTRHPCKLPSDVQKVKAVERLELRDYTDVVVFSTKGKRSLASYLGGGDYDGDKVEVFWNPEIVQNFKPPPQHFADEPEGLNKLFKVENETVDAFLARTPPDMPDSEKIYEMQQFLLSAVRDEGKYIGIYNDFYLRALYTLGYGHIETKRLAFSVILDGAKTGKEVTRAALESDRAVYGGRKPACFETQEEKDKNDRDTRIVPKRPVTMPKFIMDWLKDKAKALAHCKNDEARNQLDRLSDTPDPDLLASFERVRERITLFRANPAHLLFAETLEKELEALTKQVDEIKHEKDIWAHRYRAVTDSNWTSLPIEERQDCLRAFSTKFASSPLGIVFCILEPAEQLKVKASYAYRQWPRIRFPWDVAFRALGEIKSNSAPGGYKPLSSEFYFHMKITNSQKRRP